MTEKNIRLSSTELGGLWSNFMQDSMAICILKHFIYNIKDEEIKPLLQKSLIKSQSHMQQMKQIYDKE